MQRVAAQVSWPPEGTNEPTSEVGAGGNQLKVIVWEVAEHDIAVRGETAKGLEVSPDVADPAFLGECCVGPGDTCQTALEVRSAHEEKAGLDAVRQQGPAPPIGHRSRAGEFVGRYHEADTHNTG